MALLVAVGAAESGRPAPTFTANEPVRLAGTGVAVGVDCEGCPSLPDLMARYEQAGGQFLVCPICFNAKRLEDGRLIGNARLGGTAQLLEWIGDDGATTFSY